MTGGSERGWRGQGSRKRPAEPGSGGADLRKLPFGKVEQIDDVDGPPRPQRNGAILSRHNSDKEPRHGF